MDFDALRANLAKQQAHVRDLKARGAPQEEITAAVETLQSLRKQAEELAKEDTTGEAARPPRGAP